jgi:hypothetical protein
MHHLATPAHSSAQQGEEGAVLTNHKESQVSDMKQIRQYAAKLAMALHWISYSPKVPAPRHNMMLSAQYPLAVGNLQAHNRPAQPLTSCKAL